MASGLPTNNASPQLSRRQLLDLEDDLIRGYSRPEFQEELRSQWRQAAGDPVKQGRARQSVCQKVQLPIIARYGFEASQRGLQSCVKAYEEYAPVDEFEIRGKLLEWLVNPTRQDCFQQPEVPPDLSVPELDPLVSHEQWYKMEEELITSFSTLHVQMELHEAFDANKDDLMLNMLARDAIVLRHTFPIARRFGFGQTIRGVTSCGKAYFQAQAQGWLPHSRLWMLNLLWTPSQERTIPTEALPEPLLSLRLRRLPLIGGARESVQPFDLQHATDILKAMIAVTRTEEFQTHLHEEWAFTAKRPLWQATARSKACWKVVAPVLNRHGIVHTKEAMMLWAETLESVAGNEEIAENVFWLLWLTDPAEQASNPEGDCPTLIAVPSLRPVIDMLEPHFPLQEADPESEALQRNLELDLQATLRSMAEAQEEEAAPGTIRGGAVRIARSLKSLPGDTVEEPWFVDELNAALKTYQDFKTGYNLGRVLDVATLLDKFECSWALVAYLTQLRFQPSASIQFQILLDVMIVRKDSILSLCRNRLEAVPIQRAMGALKFKAATRSRLREYVECLMNVSYCIAYPSGYQVEAIRNAIMQLSEVLCPQTIKQRPADFSRLPQTPPEDAISLHLVANHTEESVAITANAESTVGDLKSLLVDHVGLPASLELIQGENEQARVMEPRDMLILVGNPVFVEGVSSLTKVDIDESQDSPVRSWKPPELPIPKITLQSGTKMLSELVDAYLESEFQTKYFKQRESWTHVNAALDVQASILPKYGYDGTVAGVKQMRTQVDSMCEEDPVIRKVQEKIWQVLQFREPAPPSIANARLELGHVKAWDDISVLGPHTRCRGCKLRAQSGNTFCCFACERHGDGNRAAPPLSEDDTAMDGDGHDVSCKRLAAYTLWTSWWESCRIDKAAPEPCHCLVVPPLDFREMTSPAPVILFLTGKGHVNGKEDFFAGGVDYILRNYCVRKEYIVVAPRPMAKSGVMKINEWGTLMWSEDGVWAMFTEVLRRLGSTRADTSRLYITGLSMGASAVWAILSKYGKAFAAAAPISGYAEWPSDRWPRGSGPTAETQEVFATVPLRAYEIRIGEGSSSPLKDLEWLNWGVKEQKGSFQVRGLDKGSKLTVSVRTWDSTETEGTVMEFWSVKGPLKDSEWLNMAWGGDDHCLWYRVYPFQQWGLINFFAKYRCPTINQWKFSNAPLELDSTGLTEKWVEHYNQDIEDMRHHSANMKELMMLPVGE